MMPQRIYFLIEVKRPSRITTNLTSLLLSCKMHNNATLGNKISRLARALCFWLRVLPSACKTELISFSSKLLVSFLTRFHRITSQPSDDSEPFAAQRNYFLIQSARDGALNKRLTQSVLSTHTHGSVLNEKPRRLQRSVISPVSTRLTILSRALLCFPSWENSLFSNSAYYNWLGRRAPSSTEVNILS
jgi:hypothetical protein